MKNSTLKNTCRKKLKHLAKQSCVGTIATHSCIKNTILALEKEILDLEKCIEFDKQCDQEEYATYDVANLVKEKEIEILEIKKAIGILKKIAHGYPELHIKYNP